MGGPVPPGQVNAVAGKEDPKPGAVGGILKELGYRVRRTKCSNFRSPHSLSEAQFNRQRRQIGQYTIISLELFVFFWGGGMSLGAEPHSATPPFLHILSRKIQAVWNAKMDPPRKPLLEPSFDINCRGRNEAVNNHDIITQHPVEVKCNMQHAYHRILYDQINRTPGTVSTVRQLI